MILQPNSLIAVIAPAGIPKREGLESGMALLRSWGYRVVEGKHMRDRHLFTAGNSSDRTADLLWALTDPAIDAVWFARGGYGSIHCLPALSCHQLADRLVVGFSDATALFCALLAKGHRNLVHGPILETLAVGVDDETRLRVRSLISGQSLMPLRGRHLCGPITEVVGPVIGGNLCVLASLAGTPWAASGRGAIFVLEDIGETAYRLDRFVNQLRWSGSFDGIAGIALGDFVSCEVPDAATFSVQDVLLEALEPLGVPVIAGLPIGHGTTNLSWRYGSPGTLSHDSLRFE